MATRPDLTICPASRQTQPLELHDLAPADPHCLITDKRAQPCRWVVCRTCGWVVDATTGSTMPGPKSKPPAPGVHG